MTTTMEREHRSAVSILVSAEGLPTFTTEERDAHLKAIGSAAPEALTAVLREHGSAIYANPDNAEAKAKAWKDAAAEITEDVRRMRRTAVFIIRNARKADPKVDLLSIGLAVEGITRDESTPEGKRLVGAVKQRWSRFGLAVDLVAESQKAVDEKRREHRITEDHALAAARTTVKREELRKMAREGLALPQTNPKPQQTNEATDGEQEQEQQRTYSGAAVLNAINTAVDRAKHFDRSKVSQEQATAIAAALVALTAAVANVKAAEAETPAPSADERKSTPTPKDAHAE